MAVIRMKIGSPAARRDVMLTAAKVTAVKGLEMGIVDSVHGSATETVEAAVKLGEEIITRGADGHVYGKMRETLVREVLLYTIGLDENGSSGVRISGSKL
ncbi:Enoyl-CoA delta isomerase 1, peroxisomal [Cardamine amara subsp. amara]|uniref:Enoyl-CoA delta isomerase 1, peroxisomal n=1 Tax=Cardamine amara subsp. amara TaxID=228776 RepID=A0ABD1C0V1_CARAN